MSGRRPTHSRLGVRRRRRGKETKFRLAAAKWVDPFPWIQGTLPEKMVFAELVRQRIYFIFQGDFPKKDKIQVTADDPGFIPDFIIPEWKVIVDPFGDYHHSKADARANDARKSVYYEALGYEFIHPWSSDIERLGPDWTLQQSKRLFGPPLFTLDAENAKWKATQGYYIGVHEGVGLAGIRAVNRKRTRPKLLTIRVPR